MRDRATIGPASWHADYLNPREATSPNQVDKSLQTTRRFDALKLWLTLRTMGPDLIGQYVDTVIELATDVHAQVRGESDLEFVAAPELSTLVFRYLPAGRLAGGAVDEVAVAALNNAIRAELYASGTAMVAATRVDGIQHLKLTLLNPNAREADLVALLALVREAGSAAERLVKGAA